MFASLQLVKLSFYVNLYLFIHLAQLPITHLYNLFGRSPRLCRIFCTASLLNLLRRTGNSGEVCSACGQREFLYTQ